MASNVKDVENKLFEAVNGLVVEYDKAKSLYDHAGLDVKLKESALQGMANALQLSSVAIQNFANWKHILREDQKLNRKKS